MGRFVRSLVASDFFAHAAAILTMPRLAGGTEQSHGGSRYYLCVAFAALLCPRESTAAAHLHWYSL